MSNPSNIIICADGTWNEVLQKDPQTGQPVSTNVARLASMIVPVVRNKDGSTRLLQKVFYMQGVGSSKEESLEGGAFGFGLTENIMRAYSFIVKNYTPGDRLYFFGFSRGAYTVRSLGGLLRTAGILRGGETATATVDDAMNLYCNPQFEAAPDLPACQIFRRMHSHPDNTIECIGVWDTVGSLGIPSISPKWQRRLDLSWHFHDVSLGRHVNNAFHALAVHERRSTFPPAIWKKAAGGTQNLVQRWFPGAHSDVGGGYVPDVTGSGASEKRYLLSNLALSWMIEMTNGTHAAAKAGLQGLAVDKSIAYEADWKKLLNIGTDNHLQLPHNSRGIVWRILDRIMGRKDGYVRPYGSSDGDTCESIDDSVRECLDFFDGKDEDKKRWKTAGLATHATFIDALKLKAAAQASPVVTPPVA